MSQSHTYAMLGVSEAAFEEIHALLEAAGYHHAIHDDMIDMHGIALTKGEKKVADDKVAADPPVTEDPKYQIEDIFVGAFEVIQERVYRNAKAKGFWKDYEKGDLGVEQVGLKLALVHSEISEALEAIRNGYPASKKIPEIGNFEEELADAVIRLMDLAESCGLNLGDAIVTKMAYNAGRPYMHGGKKA